MIQFRLFFHVKFTFNVYVSKPDHLRLYEKWILIVGFFLMEAITLDGRWFSRKLSKS